jgi:hypothetical protein
MSWSKPIKIRSLIEKSIKNLSNEIPPEKEGIYIITEKFFEKNPDHSCNPRYVGRASYLIRRIGDLLSDILGFYIKSLDHVKKGHHSGGQTIHSKCIEINKDPLDLYISWKVCNNSEEEEDKYIKEFNDLLWNKKGKK